MRKEALLPANLEAEMPEVYRTWKTCKEWGVLWWEGGLAAQPHLLMLEFSVCQNASTEFQDQLINMERILA